MRWTARFRIASLSLGLCLSSAVLLNPTAEAAPYAASPAPIADAARNQSEVTPVILVRRCWTRHGIAHCRWIDNRVLPYRWYDPNRYRTGSTSWWRAMDLEGRGGFRR